MIRFVKNNKRQFIYLLIFILCSCVGFLNAQVNDYVLGVPIGHSDSVEKTEFSNNGELLISVSESNKIMLWNTENGRFLYEIPNPENRYIENIRFTQNDQYLIILIDQELIIWEVNNQNLLKKIPNIISFETSPTTNEIIVQNSDLEIWKETINQNQPTRKLKTRKLYTKHQFSSLGNILISITDDYEVSVWNYQTMELISEATNVENIKISTDEQKIAFYRYDLIEIVSLSTNKTLNTINNEKRNELYLSNDFNKYYERSDQKIIIKKIDDQTKLDEIILDQDYFFKIVFTKDQSLLYTVLGHHLNIYNLHTKEKINTISVSSLHPDNEYLNILSIEYNPEKKISALLMNKDHRIHLLDHYGNRTWDILVGKTYTAKTIFNKDYNINTINGDYITTAQWNQNKLSIWDHWNMKLQHEVEIDSGKIEDFYVDLNKNFLAINATFNNNTNATEIWDLLKFQKVKRIIPPDNLFELENHLKVNTSTINNKYSYSYIENNFGLDKLSFFSNHNLSEKTLHSQSKEFGLINQDSLIYILSDEGNLQYLNDDLNILRFEKSNINQVKHSQDQSTVALLENSGKIKIINTPEFKLRFEINDFSEVNNFGFTNTNKYFYLINKNTIYLYDAINGKRLQKINLPKNTNPNEISFDPKDEHIFIISSSTKFYLWSILKKQMKYELTNPLLENLNLHLFGAELPTAHFRNDYHEIIIALKDKTLIFDLDSGSLKAHIEGKFNTFLKEGKIMVTKTIANGFYYYDLENNHQELLKQFFIDNTPLYILPEGYYFAPKKIASNLYYKKGLETIGFEQLDLQFNRPDLVLERLGEISGVKNKALIIAYKNAWKKRLKLLNIDSISLSKIDVPFADFKNRHKVPRISKSELLSLDISAYDKKHKLQSLNLWINDVPLYGKRGLKLGNRVNNKIDSTITLKLSQGINKIELSTINERGLASMKKSMIVHYNPDIEIKEKLYYVGIGIDQYNDHKYNLDYSVKDIKDLSSQLKEKYGENIEIHTLYNQNVTKENIIKLKKILENTNVNDKVIISFSGHGLLSKSLEYYLATYDVDFQNPEKKGLSYDILEDLLDHIPARKKLLLIDACHSGEIDKEEIVAVHNLEKNSQNLRGSIAIDLNNTSSLGLKNSFELMKELFSNVSQSTGATVISAAGGTQFAQEGGNLKNGVFTYAVLSEMKNSETIKISELKSKITQKVVDLTNGLQQPTSRNETIHFDWNVW